MNIRLAEEKDKENVLAILDELIAEVNKKMGASKKHTGNEKRYAMYDELIKRNDIKFFIAEKNNKVVGLGELHIVPILRRGYYQGVIESFVVTKSLRGKGIGSALIEEIINYCKAKNISVIKVNSGIELTDAHTFYEKHGGKFTEKLFRFDLNKI